MFPLTHRLHSRHNGFSLSILQPCTCASAVLCLVLALLVPSGTALTHGWDCIACNGTGMLAANFGTFRKDITLNAPWWLDTIANSFSLVMLNTFWDTHYNGTGTDNKVTVARSLKARNPGLRIMFYQPADRLGDTVYVQNALESHPEWWLRDDNGNVVPFGSGGTRKQIDPSVPGAQRFFANLSISLFKGNMSEAARCLDGVFVDGVSYRPFGGNFSSAR